MFNRTGRIAAYARGKESMAMAFSLSEYLRRSREDIIEVWVGRLKKEAGEQYARRPKKELLGTVSEAFDANYHLIIHDDYRQINNFINKITKMRLETGFLLSDVQKAFELFRTITVPRLAAETSLQEFAGAVVRIDHCLYYTIHRLNLPQRH